MYNVASSMRQPRYDLFLASSFSFFVKNSRLLFSLPPSFVRFFSSSAFLSRFADLSRAFSRIKRWGRETSRRRQNASTTVIISLTLTLPFAVRYSVSTVRPFPDFVENLQRSSRPNVIIHGARETRVL